MGIAKSIGKGLSPVLDLFTDDDEPSAPPPPPPPAPKPEPKPTPAPEPKAKAPVATPGGTVSAPEAADTEEDEDGTTGTSSSRRRFLRSAGIATTPLGVSGAPTGRRRFATGV